MKLTIGMASFNNREEVKKTIKCLRMYHDLSDSEILVVDNFGDDILRDWISYWGSGAVRYERFTEIQGTAAPRQKVFELAKGEFVICIDSHMTLFPGALDKLWDGPDLIHGPMAYDDLRGFCTRFENVWRDSMWGIWGPTIPRDLIPKEPFDIWGHGLGLFGCRKDSWLGFNPGFRQFGGEEGYIHEKYRKAGRRVICLPWMIWNHDFRDGPAPYQSSMIHRVRNYILGHEELKMDTSPILNHFGINLFNAARRLS